MHGIGSDNSKVTIHKRLLLVEDHQNANVKVLLTTEATDGERLVWQTVGADEALNVVLGHRRVHHVGRCGTDSGLSTPITMLMAECHGHLSNMRRDEDQVVNLTRIAGH